MGDVLSPFTISSPPPPSSLSNKNNSIPMLYYGLVVVGTAAIVLAIYNLVLLKRSHTRQTQASGQNRIEGGSERTRSFDSKNLLSSFKYKKGVMMMVTKESEEEEEVVDDDDDDEFECSVCLSVYEEGEEVRKLPQCKHFFHVICIDMWLYSHLDCPICRTPVDPLFSLENSHEEGFMESAGVISLDSTHNFTNV